MRIVSITFPSFLTFYSKFALLMKTDGEITHTKLESLTQQTGLDSVFMNVPIPQEILSLHYRAQSFSLTARNGTFAIITLSISDQGDNTNGFEVTGMMKCFEGEKEIKLWHFQLGTEAGERKAKFKMHVHAEVSYSLVPLVSSMSTNRDVAFCMNIEYLEGSDCQLVAGPESHLFKLRLENEMN
jgi:hypothetical protein